MRPRIDLLFKMYTAIAMFKVDCAIWWQVKSFLALNGFEQKLFQSLFPFLYASLVVVSAVEYACMACLTMLNLWYKPWLNKSIICYINSVF